MPIGAHYWYADLIFQLVMFFIALGKAIDSYTEQRDAITMAFVLNIVIATPIIFLYYLLGCFYDAVSF
jgi:hypothetical protein